MSPTPDLSRALQTPTRELLQQEADRSTFERRANAVENERAIAENELHNRLELARRGEALITQEGQNARARAEHASAEQQIIAEAESARRRLADAVQADGIRLVEGARVEAERARMELANGVPPAVLQALALRDLANNLPEIHHLSLGGDGMVDMLRRLAEAGATSLESR